MPCWKALSSQKRPKWAKRKNLVHAFHELFLVVVFCFTLRGISISGLGSRATARALGLHPSYPDCYLSTFFLFWVDFGEAEKTDGFSSGQGAQWCSQNLKIRPERYFLQTPSCPDKRGADQFTGHHKTRQQRPSSSSLLSPSLL